MPLRPGRRGRAGVVGAPVAKAAVVTKAVTPGSSPVAKAAVVGAAVTPGAVVGGASGRRGGCGHTENVAASRREEPPQNDSRHVDPDRRRGNERAEFRQPSHHRGHHHRRVSAMALDTFVATTGVYSDVDRGGGGL